MSKRSTEVEPATAQRFCSLVGEYSGEAVRWVFVSRGGQVPMNFAEFEVNDTKGRPTTPGSPSLGAYILKINSRLTKPKQKQFGVPSAEILLARLASGKFVLQDRCARLPEITGQNPEDPDYKTLAVNGLLDRLAVMESERTFIPAGMRNQKGYPQMATFLA